MSALYGIIGYPLTHSFSPGYFNNKFSREGIDAFYDRYELTDISSFPELVNNKPALRGLNVTIPYKEQVIPFLDTLTDEARGIGAVNCIDIRDGLLTGHNTDVTAFEQSISPLLKPQHDKALILGNGGAALAVKYALKRIGIVYLCVSRKKSDTAISYVELDEEIMRKYKVIINTTPLGMYPKMDEQPDIPYDFITVDHLLYDLIYNPEKTQFLAKGWAKGAAIKNGMEMLHLQAEASWKIWNHI